MVKIEKITRGQITISYKGQYYNILGEGLLLTEGNAYSYIIYRNSIDNTLSSVEQETILQAIIEACVEMGSPVILQVSTGARDYIGKEMLPWLAKAATAYVEASGSDS